MKRAQVPMTNHYNNGARGVLKNVGNGVPHGVGFGNGGAANFNGNNGFATPSEDEFDDFDDDNFLMAASQQIERQMTDIQDKGEDSKQVKQDLLDKQGEIKILRDRIDNLSREKRDAELKHQQQVNNTDKKNKKELEGLNSKLVFRDREMAELQAQLLLSKKSGGSVAKRPRLQSANDKNENTLNQHRLKGFRNKRSNILTHNLNNTALAEATSGKERAMLLIQCGIQQSNNVRSMFGLTDYKNLPKCSKRYTDQALPSKVAHCLLNTLQCKDRPSEQRIASSLLTDLACSRQVQSMIFAKILDLLKCDEGVVDTVNKLLACTEALDVWNRCEKSTGCPLVPLYRRPNKLIMRHLYNTIHSVETVHCCVCTKKLIKFVSETVIQSVNEDDTVSYREGLAVLGAMLPHFTDLKLPSTTQALFHQALHTVKTHDEALTDEVNLILDTARFECNMSLGE